MIDQNEEDKKKDDGQKEEDKEGNDAEMADSQDAAEDLKGRERDEDGRWCDDSCTVKKGHGFYQRR